MDGEYVDDLLDSLSAWGWLCAIVSVCEQSPKECEFDDVEQVDVCPEQVATCYRAVVSRLGCEPTEEQSEQLDEDPPSACAGIIGQAQEPEPEPYDEYDEWPDEYEGFAGGASA